jgi:hypothetical protein
MDTTGTFRLFLDKITGKNPSVDFLCLLFPGKAKDFMEEEQKIGQYLKIRKGSLKSIKDKRIPVTSQTHCIYG